MPKHRTSPPAWQCVLVCTIVLGVATVAVAQTADGEIAGRIHDKSGAVLPGVRVTITSSDRSREVVTNGDGRFVVRALTMGRYRVVAKLAGFLPTSGDVTLSPTGPRAFLSWPLEAGCLKEVLRVIMDARSAAPLVDAILHVRVTGADGPVVVSLRPECTGEVVQQYSVEVLASTRPTISQQRQIFMMAPDEPLEIGRDYLALLWSDGLSGSLMLPIVSGLVSSPRAGELNGMTADEALTVLQQWSQERRR